MAGVPKEKKKKAKANCMSVATMRQSMFASRKPIVPVEQEKNTRLWRYALANVTLDKEYQLPKGDHTFYTVYIHLTHEDVSVIRAQQDWYSTMCSKVRDIVDCCNRGYYLELTIDGTTIVEAGDAYVGANQESKAPNTTSSFPGQRRARRAVRQTDFSSPIDYKVYSDLVSLYTAAVCRHMDDKPVLDKIRDYEAKLRSDAGCGPLVHEDDEEIVVYNPGDANAFPAFEARVYDGRLPVLRDSICIKDLTLKERDEKVECYGGYYEDAQPLGADDPPQLGGIMIGIPLCKAYASLRDCETNTRGGIHRHGQVIMDPRTGQPLPMPTPEHEMLLDKIQDVLIGFFKQAGRRDINGCLEAARIPTRYGAQLEDSLTERIEHEPHALWNAFQKLRELGIDFTKLPRLVLSMGQHKAMCDAQSVSPIEHVTNTGFKGTTMKHLDIDEQDLRMVKFLKNARREIRLNKRKIWKKLVSTDLSKCDSTIICSDRARYSKLAHQLNQSIRRELADRYMAYKDALLSIPKVAGKAGVWWHFKYFNMYIKKEQCPLGSGERHTSNLNRVTVIINGVTVWSALLKWEDIKFVIAAWLSYDPDLDDGETALSNEHRSSLASGYYTPHGDGAFDLCVGDGDDNVLVVLSYEEMLRGDASKLVVDQFANGHKLVEPAFADEPQDRCELLSRNHVLISDSESLSYPKTKRLIQKLCMGISTHVDYVFENKVAVVKPEVAAEFATTMLQRTYQSKQHPVLRQVALAEAEFWVKQAVDGGKCVSVYSDDEQRKGILPVFQLHERLDEMRDVIANEPMHYAEFVKTNDRKYSNAKIHGSDALDNEFRMIVSVLMVTDEEWREMSILKEHIERPETFALTYHCPEIIRPILGIDAWPSVPGVAGVKNGKPPPAPVYISASTSLQSQSVLEPAGGCAQSHSRVLSATNLQDCIYEPKPTLELAKFIDVGKSQPAREIGCSGDSVGCAKPSGGERSPVGQIMSVSVPEGSGSADAPNLMVHDSDTDSEVCVTKTVCVATGLPSGASSGSNGGAISVSSPPSTTAKLEPPLKHDLGLDCLTGLDHAPLVPDGKGGTLAADRITDSANGQNYQAGVNSAAPAEDVGVGQKLPGSVTTADGSSALVSTELVSSSSLQSTGNTPPGLKLLQVSLERAVTVDPEEAEEELAICRAQVAALFDDDSPFGFRGLGYNGPSSTPTFLDHNWQPDPACGAAEVPGAGLGFRLADVSHLAAITEEESECQDAVASSDCSDSSSSNGTARGVGWCGVGEYHLIGADKEDYLAPKIVFEHEDENFKTLYCLIAKATQPIEHEALFKEWLTTCGLSAISKYPGRDCFPRKVWKSYHDLLTREKIILRINVDSRASYRLKYPSLDSEASHGLEAGARGVSRW